MLLKDFIARSVASLRDLYPGEEARGIVARLCEEVLGVKSYTHLIEPQTQIPPDKESVLEAALMRLLTHEPLQYVTGVAPFCGRAFRVTPDVLIPRPETECLVREAVSMASELLLLPERGNAPLRILDLCTGSGCIAWSLALSVPGSVVTGVDVSEAALAVARGQDFSAELRSSGARAPEFICLDILDPSALLPGPFDLILSNPPYVLESQKSQMRRNVLDHEPPLALFVPDDDALLFYHAVARWSRCCLAPWGRGIVEINEDLGPQTQALFRDAGFAQAAVLPDFFGKNRLVSY